MSDNGLRLLPQQPDEFASLRAIDARRQGQPQPPTLGGSNDGPMLLETDPQGPVDEFASLRAIDDRRRQQAEKNAIESFDLAAQHNPKIRGEAQQIARDLGLDVDTATRSIDVFREQARRKAVQDRRMLAENPVLARQLQNIEFASVARLDLDNLTAFEQFGYAWQRGALQVERGRIGERMRRFGEGEQDAKRLAQIGHLLREIPEPDSLLTGAAEVMGQMGQTLPLAARDAAIYGTAAAGVAAVAGQAGPQVALPEEVLTVPAAFVTGATFGGAMSMARQSYEVEAGNAFLDMTLPVERGGLGLDRERASTAAVGVGIANALLEVAGAGAATKAARRALSRELTQSVADALAKPTAAKAAGKFALDYAEGVGGEVLTEVMQEMSAIIGEQEAGARTDRAAVVQRLGEIIAKTTQGMALLGIPGPAMALRQNMQDVREAELAQQMFLALAKNATDSQTRANNPQAYERHVAGEIAENAPAAATTYFDAQRFAEVLAQAEKAGAGGASPSAQLRQAMPEMMERVDAALRTGDDVAVPTSQWATHVAHSEIGKAMLPHVRFSPDGISMAEAESISEAATDDAGKAMDAEQKDAEAWDAEAQAVEKALFDQLVATGRIREKRDAAKLAALWRAAVEVQAERIGETPASFAKKYPLSAAKGEVATGLGKEGGARGGIDPTTFRVTLTETSDASTFLHEMGHAFHLILEDLAQQKAHPTVVDDFAAFLKWAGVESIEQWREAPTATKVKAYENFAANFEDYLFTGQAPAPGLKKLFQRFIEFIKRAYANLTRGRLNEAHRRDFGEDLLPLSPEIRAVMDRMVASDNQVRVTQAIRGAVPAFQTKEEAGMTDEQWQAYQQQQRAADDAAVDELTRASLRDMRWLGRAKAGILRRIQQEAAREREGVRQAVAKEIQQLPVYRVQTWLKTGEVVQPDGTKKKADGEHKLDRTMVGQILAPSMSEADLDAAESLLPDDFLGTEMLPEAIAPSFAMQAPEAQMRALRKFLKADGLGPDAVALSFDFETGRGMLDAILAAPPMEQAIENETDRRMLRDHAEVADPRKVQERIERALHNETRRRFVASELRALGRSQEPLRVTLAAAKMAAEAALAGKRVRDLSNRQAFTLAARRASKEAQEALGKSGGQGPEATLAYQAKRRQLVQEFMADLAHDARAEVEKAVTQFGRFDVTDKDAARSRDVDLVQAGRALAAAYRLGSPATTDQEKQQQTVALDKIKAEHPDLAARLVPLLDAARLAPASAWSTTRGSIDYRDLTLAEFREVGAVAAWLWEQARANKLLQSQGKAVEIEKASDELRTQIASLPPRPPMAYGPEGMTPSPGSRGVLDGWHLLAGLKRMEHWARFMDGGQEGAFWRYFVAPIHRATTAFRDAQRDVVANLDGLLSTMKEQAGALWDARIEAKHLGFTFRGKKELLGALLHAGNESNLRKLLVGRKWGTDQDGLLDTSRWDRQLAEFFAAGVLTREDVAFAQAVWKQYAKLLPLQQKAHKAMYGFEFEIVPVGKIATPWGEIEGGYVPARVDRDQSVRRAPDAALSLEGLEADNHYSIPSNKSHTLTRNPNFAQPLALDLSQQMGHFDQELRFAYLMPAVKDALRLTREPQLRDALNAYDREAITGIILPHLDNTARQSTMRPGRFAAVDAAATFFRQATSLRAMGFSLIAAAIQATGISNAFSAVHGRYVRAGMRKMATGPRQGYEEAVSKSAFMRQEIDQSVRIMRERIERASLPGTVRRGIKASQQTLARWAFVPLRSMQFVASLVTWHGGYQQAIAEGKSEQDAIEFADSAVRRTQGTQNPEDQAAYEASTPFVKMFTQFSPYGNVVLNTVLHSRSKANAVMWAVLLPALLEGFIRTMLQGGPDDDDADGTVDEWAGIFGKSVLRNVAGTIPVAGPLVAQMATAEGSRVQTPYAGVMQSTWRGALETVEWMSGDDTTEAEARVIAELVTIATGVPIAAPVRYVQQLSR